MCVVCRWGSRLWVSQLSLWCIAWTTSCINYRCVCMCARAQKFTQNCYCTCFQTPQSPIVRPYLYDQYCVDEYPLGTNAVVAVITYTVSESLKWLRSFFTSKRAYNVDLHSSDVHCKKESSNSCTSFPMYGTAISSACVASWHWAHAPVDTML